MAYIQIYDEEDLTEVGGDIFLTALAVASGLAGIIILVLLYAWGKRKVTNFKN